MERFSKLSFRVAEHRVEARPLGDGMLEVRVDGAPRAEVRLSEMLGGFTFALGDRGQHRVDLLHVAGTPERLEALVRGRRFGAPPGPRSPGSGGPTILVVLIGALVAALGVLAVFLQVGAVVPFGFGRASLVGGLVLVALGPFVWRRQLWAAVAAPLVQAAVAAYVLSRLAGAGLPLAGTALYAQAGLTLLLAAAPIWLRLRPPATVVAAEVPGGGALGFRCAEHVDMASAVCAHCGRPLCARCSAFQQGTRLLCGPCGEGI